MVKVEIDPKYCMILDLVFFLNLERLVACDICRVQRKTSGRNVL